MTLIFLGILIIVSTVYAISKSIIAIEKKSDSAIKKVNNTKWISVKANNIEIGYMHLHDYPNYTPEEIINEDDDDIAEDMIQKWARKSVMLNFKKTKQLERGGWLFDASYDVDGITYKTNRIMLNPSKDTYRSVCEAMKNNSDSIIWVNSKNPKQAYLIKPTESEIEEFYRKKVNSELLRSSFIIALGLVFVGFGV